MSHVEKTPPFRGPSGELVAGSIAEVKHLRLGGVDQWVLIRGESLTNPPLVILHGGPGFSDTPFLRSCNAALEKSFTVVYWDQRGTGKSFYRDLPRSSMTVEQLLSDLDELVDAVRGLVGKTRVALFGHSFGSALGVLYAARFPDKVAAYIGSGQYGDVAAADAASYAIALSEAQRRNDRRAERALRAVGPPPFTPSGLIAQRTWLQRLEGQLGPRALWDIGHLLLGAPEHSVLDLPKIVRGFWFSLETMWDEVSRLNLIERVPALQVPVFFFLGRRDHWVPPATSRAYFDALTAPAKRLVWFEESGHEPFIDEAIKFNTAMVELVRPVCLAGRAEASPAEANKALVRRIFDEVNRHNLAGVLAPYAPDFVLHGRPPGVSPDLAGARGLLAALFAAFPDAHATIEDMIAEGDKVACRVTFRGTHQGHLMGHPPTGKAVSVTQVHLARFAGDQCVEEWRIVDELGLMQQLGLSGPPRLGADPAHMQPHGQPHGQPHMQIDGCPVDARPRAVPGAADSWRRRVRGRGRRPVAP